MKHGDRYPDALGIAEVTFRHRIRSLKNNASRNSEQLARVESIASRTCSAISVGSLSQTSFANLIHCKPARTVPAHLGKDCYSHIHPSDSAGSDNIPSVRPPGFNPFPTHFGLPVRWARDSPQIGNAVPPLLPSQCETRLRQQIQQAAGRRRKSKTIQRPKQKESGIANYA